jgi:hypothetical protein
MELTIYDSGIFWNCGLLDKQEVLLVASWHSAQLSELEVMGYLDNFADILQWIAEPGNLGKSLSKFPKGITLECGTSACKDLKVSLG